MNEYKKLIITWAAEALEEIYFGVDSKLYPEERVVLHAAVDSVITLAAAYHLEMDTIPQREKEVVDACSKVIEHNTGSSYAFYLVNAFGKISEILTRHCINLLDNNTLGLLFFHLSRSTSFDTINLSLHLKLLFTWVKSIIHWNWTNSTFTTYSELKFIERISQDPREVEVAMQLLENNELTLSDLQNLMSSIK